MAFKRLGEEKIINGTRILVYGEAGTGKTRFAMTFPKNAYINADQGGDDYYEEFADNLVMVSDSLTFSEVMKDVEEIENYLDEIETITIDSWTKIYENQQHVALKVVEQRARKAGRLVEGEGLSQREWGIIKLNAEKLASKLLGFKREGKTVIVIAEGKDITETIVDIQGNVSQKKIGIVPNAQKNFEHDFDIVLEMVRDPKTKKTLGAKVIKDRLGVTKEGDIIENPTYEIWAEAIERKRQGTKKAEKRDFEKLLKEDESSFNADNESAQIEDIKNEISSIIEELTDEQKRKLQTEFIKKLGDTKYKSTNDIDKLKKYLEVAKAIVS